MNGFTAVGKVVWMGGWVLDVSFFFLCFKARLESQLVGSGAVLSLRF